ncbi:uncharacterized protein LOC115881686 [Sitophilus oryzae]|uniref:Uncharacterized protein LOC115881686 n=1 Tax=Sitophilus oryzae TaxID=7048 RepID=A0A6J2XU92_SITOR|nr:uncharacterized protein LOC115881686 [Sitophilus oryzae]
MRQKIEELNKKKTITITPPDKPPYFGGNLNMGDMKVGTASMGSIDTSQPPPMPGTNLLQPQLLPLVNPFQYNNRLLGLMPNMANMNLPIGVPSLNMPPPMMPNLGLGLNSPFQGTFWIQYCSLGSL